MVPPSLLAGVVTPLLAHQGGWDEILMVAVPVGLFAFLLYAANKRATRMAEEPAEGDSTSGDGPTREPVPEADHRPPPRPRGPI
jgi:hypothetical protein